VSPGEDGLDEENIPAQLWRLYIRVRKETPIGRRVLGGKPGKTHDLQDIERSRKRFDSHSLTRSVIDFEFLDEYQNPEASARHLFIMKSEKGEDGGLCAVSGGGGTLCSGPSKSPRMMGKGSRAVDADRLHCRITNFVSDRMVEYQAAVIAATYYTRVSSELATRYLFTRFCPVLNIPLYGSKHRPENTNQIAGIKITMQNTAGDRRKELWCGWSGSRGSKIKKIENAGDHHRCGEETTSMLELLEHELLGLLPRVFGVS